MNRFVVRGASFALLFTCACAGLAASPGPGSQHAISAALPQGVAPWVAARNDLGAVDDALELSHITIVMKRSPERQQAFEEFLRQQQDPASPDFHHWLSAAEVGARFGAPAEGIEAVSAWLASQGLRVDRVANSRGRIEFSGSAAAIGAAFASPLHAYLVDGEARISPAAPPRIPVALRNFVAAVHGLETHRDRPFHVDGPAQPSPAPGGPKATSCSGTNCTHFIWPADFAAIYDINPVYQQGINGAGQTIAIIGRSRVYLPDIENFQKRAGLAVKDPVTVIPAGGADPGAAAGPGGTASKDQGEATLDVTRAGSVAPGATIALVVSAPVSNVDGIIIASEYVVDTNAVPAQVMSISFGSCEATRGQAGVLFWDDLFSQAAAEGISVLVSSGDSGAAGCDKAFTTPPATQVASPSYICASSFATCVGGTEFADTANPAAYWRTSNGPGLESAIGYIPEGAWNDPLDSTGGTQAASTGGGVSSFIPTPAWQNVAGVPGRQGRYTPDVSFSAAQHDPYAKCSGSTAGDCVLDSTGGFHFSTTSGTSASAPDMAGIVALLNQKLGSAQGHLNPRLYALAASPGNGVFHDVTVATSGVSGCSASIASMCNNSTPGATTTAGGLAGYVVGPGYDLATGLGSIDVANLLSSCASVSLPGQLQMPLPVAFGAQPIATQSGSAVAIITNIGGAPVTISNVTATDNAEFPATTTCFATLPPGGQCDLTVSFLPSAAGARSETIQITSNGVGSPQSFTVSGTGSSANYQGLWWAAPAGSESGWGINFAHQGDTIFATWFTYDLGGGGNWLVMTAPKSGSNTYSGTLFATSGPAFSSVPFNPGLVTANSVGAATVTFTGANDGSFAYTIGSTTQVKAITREVFGTMPTCAPATTSLSAATNYTDLWWASPAGSESGWGINLTHEGTSIFASWFTYDTNGKAMWLVATAAQTGSHSYSGTLYRTTGPAFNSVPFNPASVVATAVGSATFTFTDGNAASFAYTVNGISQTKAITREIFGGIGTICH